MLCQLCGQDTVIWVGPLTNLTGTKCTNCGGTNCQVLEEPEIDQDEIEAVDPYEITEPDREMGLLPKKWKNVVLATWELIREIAEERNSRAFVWPDEGEFNGDTFRFNEKHEGFEPLIIDIQTANVMVAVHDGLEKPQNKTKFEDWVGKGRGHFGSLVELSWRGTARSHLGEGS